MKDSCSGEKCSGAREQGVLRVLQHPLFFSVGNCKLLWIKKNISYKVAPIFITFNLHWLFCYLFLCDLRHIYHLPINLTVVRIKVIKVIKLMQGYLMHASHPAKSRTQHCQCLLLCLWMLCLCCGICRLWLKSGTWKCHGCTVLSDMSLSLLPKQLIATY